jgi:excisionase family DNA binding protein
MTAGALPIRAALAEAHADADDRRAVLRGVVDDALGPLAGRATATVEEVAELFGVARGTAYEAIHQGVVPSVRVGRRVVVVVPGLVALLLGVQTNGEADMTKAPLTNGAFALTAEHRSTPDERSGSV